MKNKRNHLWHLVDPSPWPILTALFIFNVVTAFIMYLHYVMYSEYWFLWNLFWLIYTIDSWFSDIIREATFEGQHTIPVQKGLRIGMILFIASEVMFFFSFFWGYFHFALSPSIEIGSTWPPYGIAAFVYWHIPLYNTFVLLISGVCVTWTHNEIVVRHIENKVNTYLSMILTLILAVHFTYLQICEYIMSSFNITDGGYGSIFFMTTGFHGFHVILGTLLLASSFHRLIYLHYTRNHHAGLEFAIWYWHFVDVVWLFLFVCVYWWSYVNVFY